MKRLREGHGWTRAQAAAAARITATTYGLVERGGHTRTNVLAAIAVAFGVPIESVLVPASDPRSLAALTHVQAQMARLQQELAQAQSNTFGTVYGAAATPPISEEARRAAQRAARVADRYVAQQKQRQRAAARQRRA